MAGAAVALVEGPSDVAAITTLARRRNISLDGRLTLVDIGGATNIGRAVAEFASRDVYGLCDVGELRHYRRALPDPARIFVCDRDLEDELIRALGAARTEAVIERAGDLDSFRSFQRQPAQRQRPIEDQLRRFFGTKSGRKLRYGNLLVAAVELDRVPAPLDGLLAAATRRR